MPRLGQTAPVDDNGRQIQKFMDQYEFQCRNISEDLTIDPSYILSVHTDGGFVIQKHFYSSPTKEEMMYYIERPGRDPQTVYDALAPTLEYLYFKSAVDTSKTRVI